MNNLGDKLDGIQPSEVQRLANALGTGYGFDSNSGWMICPDKNSPATDEKIPSYLDQRGYTMTQGVDNLDRGRKPIIIKRKQTRTLNNSEAVILEKVAKDYSLFIHANAKTSDWYIEDGISEYSLPDLYNLFSNNGFCPIISDGDVEKNKPSRLIIRKLVNSSEATVQ